MNLNIQLTPNFHLKEFLCDGAEAELTVSVIENLRKLAVKLEEVRKLCGNKSVKITSGFRTKAYNRKVGGVNNSQHLYGKAADIVVTGLTAKQVQDLIKAEWDGGLGAYAGFTHLDIGPKRRWGS